MNKKTLVLQKLKTKAAKFGFNKKELNDLAEQIAETIEDNDDEDQLNEAIDKAIDASLPLMRVMQSQANRLLASAKQKKKADEDEDDNDDDDNTNVSKNKGNVSEDKRFTQLEKTITQLTNVVNQLANGNITADREKRVKQVIDGTGAFGNQILKGFKRAKFESDEDFEEYLEDITKDVKSYKETDSFQGNVGPLAGGPIKKSQKKTLTDEELDEFFGPGAKK